MGRQPMRKVLLLISLLLLLSGGAEAQEPLDALELLKLSIAEMQRQDSLLAGYCYTKSVVVEQLDAELKAKKSEERLVEVTCVPDGPDIEVLVAINGKPISEKEKQRREAEREKRKSEGASRLELKSEDLITQFEWSFAGTAEVNGRPSTILSFKPKPDAVYTGDDPKAEKFLRKVTGSIWVDDEEHAISRIEFSSLGSIKSFAGLFWTLHSFSVKEERQRLPEGVWIDSGGEYFVDATALIFKKIRSRSTMHTYDYRRCSTSRKTKPPPSEGH